MNRICFWNLTHKEREKKKLGDVVSLINKQKQHSHSRFMTKLFCPESLCPFELLCLESFLLETISGSKLVNKISFTFSHPLFPLGFSYNKKDNDLLERKKRAIFLEAEFKSIWQKMKGKTLAGSDIVKKLRTNTFQNASPWRNDADKFFFFRNRVHVESIVL